MPNVLLTYSCNRGCPYCFAQEVLARSGPSQPVFIPWENLVVAADYLADAGLRSFAVLGGEPTLHPELVNIYKYILARGFHFKMFSNGCARAELVTDLARVLQPERTRFLINVNEERDRRAGETEQQERFFRELGVVCGLSFNLYRADPGLDFLIDTILHHQLRRVIRVGLAHPIADERNVFLDPTDYPAIASRLAEFARRCDERGIHLSLDCGFTLCDFTDEQLGALRRANAYLRFGCGPVIDIGPDLSTWACFPLSKLAPRRLDEFPSLGALRKHYQTLIAKEAKRRRFPGVYAKCASCRYLQRHHCGGGCHAYAFRPKEHAWSSSSR